MPVKAKDLLVERYVDHFAHVGVGVFLNPNRPWLSLYGCRVLQTPSEKRRSPIQDKLPHEIMMKLFSKLGPYGLGVVSCVCRQWYILAQYPQLWCKACLDVFAESTIEENVQLLKQHYACSWKRMFLQRPHLRFDGVYVARNTYLRTGVVEWRTREVVHLVTYFRYLAFWPNGKFRYCTTPVVPYKVAAFMGSPIHTPKKGKEFVNLLNGHYEMNDDLISCLAPFKNSTNSQFRMDVTLRSTSPGANNRLDVRRIATTKIQSDSEEDDDEDNDPQELEHKRGLSPFIFISWEALDGCLFNEPQKIDFHIA